MGVLDVVHQAAGRGHNHVGPRAQLSLLHLDGHAAHGHAKGNVCVLGERPRGLEGGEGER